MGTHFTVFGGAFVHESHGFNPPPRNTGKSVAVWGFVLASLLVGVTTVATVTATAWAHSPAVF